MPKKIQNEKKEYLALECNTVGEIAVNYGFTIIIPPHITHDDTSKAKQFKDTDIYSDSEEKVALTRWFEDNKPLLDTLPIMIHYKKPLVGSGARKKPNEESYGFEIMGSSRSTSEAVLIRTALSILSDLGYDNLFLDVNSIGDKDSISDFEHNVQVHFRKNGVDLPAKLRQEFKKNSYTVLIHPSSDIDTFIQSAPQSVSSLSETSRNHFKEVLEYIETFDVVYKIHPNILPNKLFASHTIFEIRQASDKGPGELLAYGYRYNYLAKKIGGKKDIPTVGMTLTVKKSPATKKKILIKKIKKPRFYLVQLGGTAKLKALTVVELLRKHNIPVYHSVTKDKIGGQLSGADYMKATHLLIIGQKEAIENTIVVRSIANREQETVRLDELIPFLKKLGKK